MANRVFSRKFKAAAVRRMEAGESPSALAKELNVGRKSLYQWRDQVLEGRPLRTAGRPKRKPEPEIVSRDAARRIGELEQLVGQLTLESRFFKGALQRIKQLRQSNDGSGGRQSSPKSRR